MYHSLIGTERQVTDCKYIFRNREFKSLMASIEELVVMKYYHLQASVNR